MFPPLIPRIPKGQLNLFLKDPEVVVLEVLFVFLTLSNVLVLYRILWNVCPFPVMLTVCQLLVSLLLAVVLGESGREFPHCAFFPPFAVSWKLYETLAVPILMYLVMITSANVVLAALPSVASYPVTASLAVIFHHVSRFLGSGQIYFPSRWVGLTIMTAGFVLGIFDKATFGVTVFPLALIYALSSAVFRGWCLERAMHIVEGRGNTLHNHQTVLGLLTLPPLGFLLGEGKIFHHMPFNFTRLFTCQCWGCLLMAGALPFAKNVVANRLVRRTGQVPWRLLEAVTLVILFALGAVMYNSISFLGIVAFVLVFSGRLLGALDALSTDPEDRRRAIRAEEIHGTEPPPELMMTNTPSYYSDGQALVAADGGQLVELLLMQTDCWGDDPGCRVAARFPTVELRRFKEEHLSDSNRGLLFMTPIPEEHEEEEEEVRA